LLYTNLGYLTTLFHVFRLFIYGSFKDSLKIWPARTVTQQQSISRVLHTASAWTHRNVYRALMGKPEWKRPLGRPTRRWEDTIKIEQKRDRWEWTASICLWTATISSRLLRTIS